MDVKHLSTQFKPNKFNRKLFFWFRFFDNKIGVGEHKLLFLLSRKKF